MCEDVKAKISVIEVNLLLLISKFSYMKFDIFYNIYDNIHILILNIHVLISCIVDCTTITYIFCLFISIMLVLYAE